MPFYTSLHFTETRPIDRFRFVIINFFPLQASLNSLVGIATKLSKQSIFKALERGLDGNWIKCKWKSNSVGWQSWSHPSNDDPEIKKPEWSNMTDVEIVDMVFDQRIIENLDHEALIRNTGVKH